MGGIGHGLPWWLPEGFLTVQETLALGEIDLYLDPNGRCPACVAGIPLDGKWKGDRLDPAHIVNKGAGGRPKGSGPTNRICRGHHDLLHFSNDGIQRTQAIRREDGAVCWLEHHEWTPSMEAADLPGVQITVLGFVPGWCKDGC